MPKDAQQAYRANRIAQLLEEDAFCDLNRDEAVRDHRI